MKLSGLTEIYWVYWAAHLSQHVDGNVSLLVESKVIGGRLDGPLRFS